MAFNPRPDDPGRNGWQLRRWFEYTLKNPRAKMLARRSRRRLCEELSGCVGASGSRDEQATSENSAQRCGSSSASLPVCAHPQSELPSAPA
jgi:hypothetical protein